MTWDLTVPVCLHPAAPKLALPGAAKSVVRGNKNGEQLSVECALVLLVNISQLCQQLALWLALHSSLRRVFGEARTRIVVLKRHKYTINSGHSIAAANDVTGCEQLRHP